MEGTDHYWRRYIPIEYNKKKLIIKSSRGKIDHFLVEYYKKIDQKNHRITIKDRFDARVERQKKCGVSGNTLDRYRCEYERFFKGSSILNLKIEDISDEDIRIFMTGLIKRKELSYQSVKALYGYLNGIFTKTKKDKLITANPCDLIDFLELRRLCSKQTVKTAQERTVSPENLKLIYD